MKRPKLKKASKRVSCAKRYKIQKKVREHHKKLRKEAKKKGVSKRVKKDLGVPSSAPFREEVLREAEQRRLKIEEEKEKKRQAKKEERAQKRKKEKTASEVTEPKTKKARKEKKVKGSELKPPSNKNSQRFLCKELNRVIDASEVILEVLDARDPMGCRCPQLEEAVLKRAGNKKILLVLNKIDLVPKENALEWIQRLEMEFPVVAFKASTQVRDKTVQARKRRRLVASNEVLDISRSATCLGSSSFIELLTNYATQRDTEAPLKVGVVGFPNVGKSSFINSMKGIRACNVGTTKGITKNMQEVFILKNVKLLDSPGVLALPSNPPVSLALRSQQVEEGQDSMLEAVRTLLKQCDKTQIMLQYNVADYKNSLEFLTMFAKKRGFLQKGGVPNTEQAASTFLSDWTGHKLCYHCKVPEEHSLPHYMSEATVTEMQNGWDLHKIKTGNDETIKGVKFPQPASCINFTSKGPTEGVLCVADVAEEKPETAPAEEETELNDENNEPEQPVEDSIRVEDSKGIEDSKGVEEQEPQKIPLTGKTNHVQFQPVPIDISLSTPRTDDAYDFNTDFK